MVVYLLAGARIVELSLGLGIGIILLEAADFGIELFSRDLEVLGGGNFGEDHGQTDAALGLGAHFLVHVVLSFARGRGIFRR